MFTCIGKATRHSGCPRSRGYLATSDQQVKQGIYAQAGIAEYWIVNLIDDTLEVYREPHGEQFRNLQTFVGGQHIMPLAQPTLSIRVSDLLP
jgi:Uma2 family endonuclease